MTYALTLLGGLVAGAFMLPVVNIMFPTGPDMEPSRPLDQPPRIVERPVDDYEGSVAQMVARGHGYARSAVSAVYRGTARVARHARSVVWERPSRYVRCHRKGGGYRETLHAAGSYKERTYVGRHSAEHVGMIADLEAMLATEAAHEGVYA